MTEDTSLGTSEAPADAPTPANTSDGGSRSHTGALIGAVAVVLAALIGAIGTVVVARDNSSTTRTGEPEEDSTAPSRSASITSPTSDQASSTADVPLRDGVTVTLTCEGIETQMRAGDRIDLTYDLTAESHGLVGLGASLYEIGGPGEHWDAENDIDRVELDEGRTPIPRPFVIPEGVPAGRYELVGEIWPGGEVGADGVETLDDEPCAVVTIIP